MEISLARRQLNSMDELLAKRPVIVVSRHKRPAFALVQLSYLDSVMETLEILADAEAMRMLQEAIEDIKAGRLYSHDDVAA